MSVFTFDNGAAPFSVPAHSGLIINAVAPSRSTIISIGAWLDKYSNAKNFWISSHNIEQNGGRATIVVFNNAADAIDVYGNVAVEATALPDRPTFTSYPISE